MIRASNPTRLAPRRTPVRWVTVRLPQRKRNRGLWLTCRLYLVLRFRTNGATPPVLLHTLISSTWKVYLFFYILYLAAITVITYRNNINRLVFIMENVVFSVRQKMVFHNFTARNLCLKTLKDHCLGFTRREESNLLASNSHNR